MQSVASEVKQNVKICIKYMLPENHITSWSLGMILFSLITLFFSTFPFLFTSLLCRKACTACGCSMVDHALGGDLEDDQRMGRLLTDSPCSHLTAKVKGGGGLRMYKRNRMIVTNPVVSRKDPTFNTTTYDWAPAGLNQKLVRISEKYERLVVRMKLQFVGLSVKSPDI